MPTYDYECAKCGNRFELFQSIMSKPVAVCPKCKGRAKRLIGEGAGIIFKGSGFYETDYKKKAAPKADNVKKKDSACPIDKNCKTCPESKG